VVASVSLSGGNPDILSRLELDSHLAGGNLEFLQLGEVIQGIIHILGDTDGGDLARSIGVHGARSVDLRMVEWENGTGSVELVGTDHFSVRSNKCLI
jgi:hypothetical protein